MILSLPELQRLTDRKGTVTYLNVVLKQPIGVGAGERCLQAISRLDPRLLALATAEFVQTDTRMNLASSMAWLTSLIALVIGTIGTLNSMLTSVYERTQEIGILRAIGWSKRRVMAMILLEACGLALAAGGLGVIATLIFFGGLSFYPTVRSLLPTQLDFAAMMEGVMLALAMGLLGAWIPAWRAVRMLPTEAFRHP
jgi:putative ABC transport system permease protein